MTPRSEAIAFQIWAYATPLGWDCTVNEIADELGISYQMAAKICHVKGWHNRIRHCADAYSRRPSSADDGHIFDFVTNSPVSLRDLGLSHA